MSLSDRSENAAQRTGDRAEDRADEARTRADEHADDARARAADEHTDQQTDQHTDGDADRPTVASSGASSYRGDAAALGLDRNSVLQRERERYGGVKVGAAFFGWLTATGTGVLLTALLTGAGAAVGLATNPQAGSSVQQTTVGLAGGIGLLCILFIAYYCGGGGARRPGRGESGGPGGGGVGLSGAPSP